MKRLLLIHYVSGTRDHKCLLSSTPADISKILDKHHATVTASGKCIGDQALSIEVIADLEATLPLSTAPVNLLEQALNQQPVHL